MGFLAGPGHRLGEWDLNQIEMRVMAHDSQDPDHDRGVQERHRQARLDSLPPVRGQATRLIKEHERFAAKAVNFGILMGMTAARAHCPVPQAGAAAVDPGRLSASAR